MDNRDVLRQICYRLDDASLFSLPQSFDLRRDISIFLRDNSFWCDRTQHLAGKNIEYQPKVDWRQMYYALLAVNPAHLLHSQIPIDIFDSRFVYAMESIDFLKLLEELYGPVRERTVRSNSRWYTIRSKPVLDYLLSIDQVVYYDIGNFISHINRVTADGYPKTIPYIMDLAERSNMVLSGWMLSPALYSAAATGSIEGVRILLEVMSYGNWITSALAVATENKRLELIKFLSPRVTDDEVYDILDKKMYRVSVEVLSSLVTGHGGELVKNLILLSTEENRLDLATWLMDRS